MARLRSACDMPHAAKKQASRWRRPCARTQRLLQTLAAWPASALNGLLFNSGFRMIQAITQYPGDIEGVVSAPVVRSLQRIAQNIQSLAHSHFSGNAGHLPEQLLHIDVLMVHGVRNMPQSALFLQHVFVVPGPCMLAGLIFFLKNMQGLFKRNAFFPDQLGVMVVSCVQNGLIAECTGFIRMPLFLSMAPVA